VTVCQVDGVDDHRTGDRPAEHRLTSSSEVPLHLLDGYLEVHHPASGEVMRLPMPWPIDRAGPQARRAAFTYATKQSLLQLLAIPEPDDPETAAGGGGERDGRQAHPAAVRTHPTREQVATLRRLLVDAGYADPDRAREWAATTLGRDVTDAADLSAGEVDQLLTSLAGVVRGARDTATGDDP
jgi:hypothetical protein